MLRVQCVDMSCASSGAESKRDECARREARVSAKLEFDVSMEKQTTDHHTKTQRGVNETVDNRNRETVEYEEPNTVTTIMRKHTFTLQKHRLFGTFKSSEQEATKQVHRVTSSKAQVLSGNIAQKTNGEKVKQCKEKRHAKQNVQPNQEPRAIAEQK